MKSDELTPWVRMPPVDLFAAALRSFNNRAIFPPAAISRFHFASGISMCWVSSVCCIGWREPEGEICRQRGICCVQIRISRSSSDCWSGSCHMRELAHACPDRRTLLYFAPADNAPRYFINSESNMQTFPRVLDPSSERRPSNFAIAIRRC